MASGPVRIRSCSPRSPPKPAVCISGSKLARLALDPTLANVDVRHWEAGEHQVATTLRVPSELAAGTYRVSLWLPDPDLEARPEYAIAFANADVFDAATGLDVIVPALVVDPNAPGEAIGNAHELVELP